VVRAFARSRILLLIFVMLLILIPGALTGAGSTSILISGQVAAIVLGCMGIAPVNIAAIVFIGAVLSVAAPPINIYAMIICGGVNMPYVGFFAPLAIPVLGLAVFSVLLLGWKGTSLDVEKVFAELPSPPENMKGFKVYLPLLVLLTLMVAVRVFPHVLPVIGIPLEFIISGVVALIVVRSSGIKLNVLQISKKTVGQLFPLIATLVAIGILVQVMSLTGVRGLFVITILSLPLVIVYLGLVVGLPLGEAVLLYGVAAVLGVPLVLLFSSVAKGAILVAAGISLICPLGDALPPTAILGRLTVKELGYAGSYGGFLKKTVIPWVAVTAAGLLMVVIA
jgi:CitMHS family citrate-Mg2+:H+ or citrate-Ca2+:H+ symporter